MPTRAWIRDLYPEKWLRNVKIPAVEGLANTHELSVWRRSIYLHGFDLGCYDHYAMRSGLANLARGKQRCATGSKHVLDPVVASGQGWQDHCRTARRSIYLRENKCSIESRMEPDTDFAAKQTIKNAANLAYTTIRARGLLGAAAERMQELPEVLRRKQYGTVR